MRQFIIFLFLLLFIQSGSAQDWTPIGAGTSVAEVDDRCYAMRISGERLNYDSTGQGGWCKIKPTVCYFDPPVFGYNYGVCDGEYWALFPDSSDGAIAFAAKKGRHALTLRLDAAIYYNHNKDSVWMLETASTVVGARDSNRINYPSTLPDTDWSFQYQGDRLKIGIIMTQAARDALPDPSVNGWADNETWVTFTIEMKTYCFMVGEVIAMPAIAWDTSRVSFSHSGVLQFVLPKDVAYLDSDPSIQTTLYRRLRTIDSKIYLLIGLRYTTLQNLPSGTIVFDPSPVIIGASDMDDAGILGGTSATKNYGASFLVFVGSAPGTPKRYFLRADLSSIPSNAIVTTAICSLYSTIRSNDPVVVVSKMTSDWVEGTASGTYEYGSSSWNNRGHGTGVGGTTIAEADSAWTSAGGDYDSPDDTLTVDFNGWLTWEVENIVQDALDAGTYFGFLFRDTTESGLLQHKVETTESATESRRPRLYVEYELPEDGGSGGGQGSWKNWGTTQWGQ